MPTSTSGSSNYSTSRDTLCTQALRICGALGEGETASSTQLSEAAGFLNDLVKELQTDGMPLWKVRTYTAITLTATGTYNIGIGQTVNQVAPLKIVQAWTRDNTNASDPRDSPIIILPKMDYDLLGNKSSTGTPNQLWYDTPGANVYNSGTDIKGVITLFPVPDSFAQANKTLMIVGQLPFEDFDAAADVPDFPSYWFNALKWLLAADLCYIQGTPYAERSMILKMAGMHKDAALSFGTEEGSLQLQPRPQWGDQTWHSGSNN